MQFVCERETTIVCCFRLGMLIMLKSSKVFFNSVGLTTRKQRNRRTEIQLVMLIADEDYASEIIQPIVPQL